MIQKHFEKEETKSNQRLMEEFEKLSSKKVEKATTKIVNVKKFVGCGCGGAHEKFNVEVPADNPISNGDYIDKFSDDMFNIKKGWV